MKAMCSSDTVSDCYDSRGGTNITRTLYCVTLGARSLSCSLLFSVTFIHCTDIYSHVNLGSVSVNAPDVLRGVDVS